MLLVMYVSFMAKLDPSIHVLTSLFSGISNIVTMAHFLLPFSNSGIGKYKAESTADKTSVSN